MRRALSSGKLVQSTEVKLDLGNNVFDFLQFEDQPNQINSNLPENETHKMIKKLHPRPRKDGS
jgi:hypothetical protein